MSKVTIIVPTYNRQELLRDRCLPSIFNQTYKNWELIIVNDGGAVINNIKDATVINLAENHGKSYCVNKAIRESQGGPEDYILVVDDDNALAPTFLEETIKTVEEESAKQLKISNSDWHAITTGRVVYHKGYTDYAPPFDQWGLGFAAIDWGWLIKRKVFDVVQYDETLYGDEDADFGIQFYKHFRAYALDKPLQYAWAYGDDQGVCLPTRKRLESLDRFIEKNWEEYEEAGPKDLSFIYRFAGRNYYLAGHKGKAISYFWKCFKAWPNRRTLTHLLVSLISYKAYYYLMRAEEKYYSKKRMKQLK